MNAERDQEKAVEESGDIGSDELVPALHSGQLSHGSQVNLRNDALHGDVSPLVDSDR